MMNHFILGKRSKQNRRKGFTLMETLLVVGILAILCSIIFIGVAALLKSMRFKQANDYAKTIFMAAQSNLTAMRNSGELAELEGKGKTLPEGTGFPAGEGTDQYVYTSSSGGGLAFADYASVLPVNSVETHIRGKQVIIEYNPVTGNVYAVFYCENKNVDILSMYRNGQLPRDEEARRDPEVGYHEGSILSQDKVEELFFEANLEYINDQEGYVRLTIKEENVPATTFKSNMEVSLTLTGKVSGAKRVVKLMNGTGGKREKDNSSGNTVKLTYMLDSLADGLSFVNFSAQNESKGLGEFAKEDAFTFLPGEQVTVEAEVAYKGVPLADEAWSNGKSITVNPMFADLSSSGLMVGNGRNLQNLNALTPSIATTVKAILITADIDWNATVEYYNKEYGKGGTYQNRAKEAPGRALPYFVPIHNAPLMGAANVNGVDVTFPSLDRNPAIRGNGKKIIGLNIDSTKYATPSGGEYYVSATTSQIVHYSLTGLFTFVNSEVSDLTIVNSKIKGLDFASSTGTCATGSLAGVAGYKAFFKNCAVYMERNTLEDYAATTGPKAYKADGTMDWYGVSGEGCVGGLVGYSISQRLADGYIYTLEHVDPDGQNDDYIVKTINENEVTFYKCYSAVPVSGNMRGSGSTNYGYVNGVGGLVGLTRISNFYGCYASGKVMATGVYTTSLSTNWSILNLNGKKSMGAGGLVGTSQGSMYWNCFATGDVEANQASGTGSFLGVMVYNAKFTASSVDYTHLSLMEDCYTTGKVNGSNGSAFVGGNASIDLTSKIQSSDKIYTEYYQMIAPYFYEAKKPDQSGGERYDKIYAPTSPELYKSGSVTYYYIAKDCYYLDLSRTDEQVDPDRTNIGTGICYDILMDMVNSFSSSRWVDKQWENILTWTTDDGKTFETAYYNIKNLQIMDYFVALKNFYKLELPAGFDDVWRDSDLFEGETYSFINPGAEYSFAMIDGLDYHGEWPTMPLVLNGGASGLAYWEWYADANGEFDRIYAQFDREDTGDLLSNDELREMGAWVVADGFAVVAPNNTQAVKVKVGTAAAVKLTYARPWTYNGQTVYLYPLTRAVLNNSAGRLTKAEDFYVQVTITVGTKNYTAFYNPYCANSQVNPVMINRDEGSVPTRPAAVPAQLEIRTARQLVGLMQTHSQNQLAEGYNYIQTLDIDASKWTGGSTASTKIVYSASDKTSLKNLLTTSNGIGSLNTAGSSVRKFLGTYTGVGAGDDRPIIANFYGRKFLGLFMHIGAEGKVSNLILKQDSGTTWDYSGAKINGGAGMLADVNEGTIRNVDVVIRGAVTLKAKVNAGLLVGKSTAGTIENCNVSATAVTLSVTDASGTAGGMVGSLAGSVKGGSVNITSSLTATAKNVGGLAGLATKAAVQNVNVNVKSLTYPAAGTYVGGLAGYFTGGSCTDVNITVSGTSTAHGGLASLVDDRANIKNVNVTIEGTMTAANAGGLASTANGITVGDCTVTVKGTLTGTTSAAGLVGTYNVTAGYSCSDSTVVVEAGGRIAGPASAGFVKDLTVDREDAFKKCTVELDGGEISGYSTAGFAASINGTVQDCAVVGTGTITGNTNAVGFVMTLTSGSIVNSRVTPAYAQKAEVYWGESNTNLKINGATSAGFVKTVSSGAKVLKCDALCEVTGNAPSGFATANNGEINGCMANVAITKGSAFVETNSSTGIVNNCYGWYGDGSTNTTAVAVPGATVGKYFSCYFADLDIPSNQAGNLKSVTLFDNRGASSKMTQNDLTTAYNKLATTNNNQWSQPGKFETYSYGMASSYCYPMLREHCGNWAVPSVNAINLTSYEGDSSEYVADSFSDSPIEVVYVTLGLTDAIRKECIIL